MGLRELYEAMRAIPRGTWQHRHIPVEKTVTANTAYTAVTVGHGAGTVLDLDIHGSPVPILNSHERRTCAGVLPERDYANAALAVDFRPHVSCEGVASILTEQ